jgi:hypothetical protein
MFDAIPRIGRQSSSMVSSVNETVEVHKFVSHSPIMSQDGANTYRLPNDVRERNALYRNEIDRSMSGVEARVRNVRASRLVNCKLPSYRLLDTLRG